MYMDIKSIGKCVQVHALALVELARCAHSVQIERYHLHMIQCIEHLAYFASGSSAADRSQPELRGGSNSEETTNMQAR